MANTDSLSVAELLGADRLRASVVTVPPGSIVLVRVGADTLDDDELPDLERTLSLLAKRLGLPRDDVFCAVGDASIESFTTEQLARMGLRRHHDA